MINNGREMRIVLTDETKDGRFLSTNTANNAAKAATETKTEKPVTGGSTPGEVFSAVGNQLVSQSPLGRVQQIQGYIKGVSAVTIALTALNISTNLYKEWKNRNVLNDQHTQTRLQAGGAMRGDVNQMNRRYNMFTGRTSGTYIRR